MTRINHFIIIRFSVVFKDHSFNNNVVNKMNLFSDDRMKYRLYWFKHICLFSLLNQTNKNYKVIVLIDKDLPKKWYNELVELIRPVYNIILHIWDYDNEDINKVDWMNNYLDNDCEYLSLTRLDDDDGIHKKYFEYVLRMIEKKKSMISKNLDFFIVSRHGNYLLCINRLEYYTKRARCKSTAVGLTYVVPRKNNVNVYFYDHSKLHDYGKCVVLSNTFSNSYLIVNHEHNNSNRFRRDNNADISRLKAKYSKTTLFEASRLLLTD